MAKYLVDTYYTCSFKVSHYLDNISESELSNLEKRDDGKFEILDVKMDNRKTKNLDPKNSNPSNKKINILPESTNQKDIPKDLNNKFVKTVINNSQKENN